MIRCNVRLTTAPRTRGWTRARDSGQPERHDCPAHAGMDPLDVVSSDHCLRLPRARGDGPHLLHDATRLETTAPRTRGWTQALQHRRRRRPDCPAHAGMDPMFAMFAPHLPGLPRARGDGPAKMEASRYRDWTAPRTRGWTRGRLARLRGGQDCPAHAGMDLMKHLECFRVVGLPRARGDGPDPVMGDVNGQRTAPRTRGWTREHRETAACLRDCPAHAGMDPRPRPLGPSTRRLPRARGDGPTIIDNRDDA